MNSKMIGKSFWKCNSISEADKMRSKRVANPTEPLLHPRKRYRATAIEKLFKNIYHIAHQSEFPTLAELIKDFTAPLGDLADAPARCSLHQERQDQSALCPRSPCWAPRRAHEVMTVSVMFPIKYRMINPCLGIEVGANVVEIGWNRNLKDPPS